MSENSKHYAYKDYASEEYANSYDATRFGDIIGEWICNSDHKLLKSVFEVDQDENNYSTSILDVGTGTGRIALGLADMKFDVTGIDASMEMLSILKSKSLRQKAPIRIKQGDAMNLPFADKSFDYSISFMTLMHVPDWKRMLNEMCRVSSKGVLVQFQSMYSYALLSPIIQPLRRKRSRVYQKWSFHKVKDIKPIFWENGFKTELTIKQLLFPVAFHRFLNNFYLSKKLEYIAEICGLKKLIGNPVVIFALREKL